MNTGVSSTFAIAGSRLTCSMLSMSKRSVQAITDGQAEILLDEPASAPASSGVAGWIIAVAVVGALLALIALVAVVVYAVFIWKKNPLDGKWEKY